MNENTPATVARKKNHIIIRVARKQNHFIRARNNVA